MKSQEQMFWETHKRIAEADRHVMELARHPTNPLTNSDLETLVNRYPERWGKYRGLIGKLPN
ncbi:hypothetical protein [Acidihalobacter prosperus]|uniref:Uncharacterized protein n=1 Tax=Acidihalobacter prosperus TaxID=160660 RepID=A0A1A6C314_9GAMM|nr:hypothetical protein [Acidihalobacter prosperus]OBS08935.1 hypothetical protein Thpro_022052 [Acidihalobacter prosperus]